ncbi:EEP domain-containing protein, partial [Xanthomonas perforans]|nr:EEP domain-containing protein [Xanthomonas perforans]
MNASDSRTLRVLTANIQAGSSTRRYSDYVTRSWSHALPLGSKRTSLDSIAKLVG